jgi:dTDP-4-amino-4,6-dideoxygalactose transaminase
MEFVKESSHAKANYWLGAVMLKDKEQRDKFLDYTNKNGVMTRPIWRLMSELEMFKSSKSTKLDNAKYLEQRVLNIPSSVRV